LKTRSKSDAAFCLRLNWPNGGSFRRGDEPLNFVVVGGGPTGVELAGILAEIARHVLAHEFRSIDPSRAPHRPARRRPRVLPAYAEDLSRSAEEQLRHWASTSARTRWSL